MNGVGSIFSSLTSIPPIPTPLSASSSSSRFPKAKPSKTALPLIHPPASRIFVKNLPYSAGEASLIKLFSKFGPIVEVKLAKHGQTRRSKGYAFIQYSSQDDAILAMDHMDNMIIDGRIVYVAISKPTAKDFTGYPVSSGPPSPKPTS